MLSIVENMHPKMHDASTFHSALDIKDTDEAKSKEIEKLKRAWVFL